MLPGMIKASLWGYRDYQWKSLGESGTYAGLWKVNRNLPGKQGGKENLGKGSSIQKAQRCEYNGIVSAKYYLTIKFQEEAVEMKLVKILVHEGSFEHDLYLRADWQPLKDYQRSDGAIISFW